MRLAIIFIFVTVTVACGPSSDEQNLSADELAGTYTGIVPCADCEGIDYSLTLAKDMSFSDRMDFIGKTANALTATGEFSIKDGMIFLSKPTIGFSKFRQHPEGLLMLDDDGEEITGETAEMYVLRKTDNTKEGGSTGGEVSSALPDSMIKPRQDNTEVDEAIRAKARRHITQWTDGVNFYALGTEPFWSLKIRFAEGMQFTTMDGYEIRTPIGDASLREAGRFTKYTAETEAGELIVEFEEGECTDQMSGEKFDYAVTVLTKKSVDREYQTFKGCGEYVVDPRLHNIWIVEKFEGEALDHTQFKRGIPQLEINVRNDEYLGHDGCNSIRGNVVIEDRMITFEPGPTTLMACDDGGLSDKISQALTQVPYEFEIGQRLVLKERGKVRFVLKNVD